jgi:MFS family permease
VAIALPTIGGALHTRAAALQWLVSAYPLSSGCLLLFCGHLADVHGRKRVFIGGSLILFAFTLACGFAQDEVTLAVLRGLQGVGGAATIPAAVRIRSFDLTLVLTLIGSWGFSHTSSRHPPAARAPPRSHPSPPVRQSAARWVWS